MTDNHEEVTAEVEIPVVALPGSRLRETRDAARMSLEEVAHNLHLDVQIIKSLEEDMYDRLPSPIYVSGYLRAYARLLKLPEKEIVGAYTQGREINASLIPENINILPVKKQVKPGVLKLIVLAIVAVIVIAAVLWLSEETDLFNGTASNDQAQSVPMVLPQPQNTQESDLSVEQNIAQPPFIEPETTNDTETELTPPSVAEIEQKIAEQQIITPPPKPKVSKEPSANKTQANADLRFVFNEDSWAEVTDAKGTRHLYRLVQAGSELFIDGVAPFKVLLGKANVVKVFYKGEEFNHQRFHRDDIAYFRVGAAE